jgi:tight adherence protein C
MTLMQMMVLGLVFAATTGLCAALAGMFLGDPLKERLQSGADVLGADEAAPSAWKAKLAAALAPASRLTLPEEGWQNSPLRQRFLHAGMRGEHAVLLFFAGKTLLSFALPALFVIATALAGPGMAGDRMLMCVVFLAALGYYAPNVYLARRIAARQLELFEGLPDAIDLMTVMVEAGLGLDAAIARIADEMGSRSKVVGEEFKLVGLELRAGASRNQALRNLALRTGVEEVEFFVAMLVQTDRFGTSMADSLRVHSDTLRQKRMLKAEEAAAKIGLKLLFPLVFCIFPAIMVVLIGPAAITIYRNFFPVAAAGVGG